MRVTSFLAGAAAGAAAVMYMNRTNKTVLMGFSQLGDNVNKMMDKAMMAMADKNMKIHKEPETNASLDKVEELAGMDPKVKSEVDQILAENHVNSTPAGSAHTSAGAH
ncbi:MAG: hypothetical protein K0R57_3272 [Paenibacillaceae bacterium]|jgi:hypothetical protein|nr:hypothetical protein [Paenibacillaceae bacterium]